MSGSQMSDEIESEGNHECELCGCGPAYFDYDRMTYLCELCREELEFEDEAFGYFLWGMMLSAW